MKKLVLWGTALALTALLIFSCNKNRFDFDHLEGIEASGQWKLPIGSMNITLGEILDRLGNNDLISYDENGNYQIRYDYAMDQILKGSDFLNLGTLSFDFQLHIDNADSGLVFLDSIHARLCFSQEIKISMDSAGIETAVIKSGNLLMAMNTDLGRVREIVFSSPDIMMPNNDTLACVFQETMTPVDLAGATFTMKRDPVTGFSDSTLVFNYVLLYEMSEFNPGGYDINTQIELTDVKIQEVTGYIDHYEYDFTYDTLFSLPINNINGGMSLVGVDLQIREKNSFGFDALLEIDQAEFYAENGASSHLFSQYPCYLHVQPSSDYTNVTPDVGGLNDHLGYHTDYNGVRLASKLILNPTGGLISINDTSSLGLEVSAVVPFQFNIPGVYYLDTMDIQISGITGPELVREIILGIIFESELPFNISGQLYTIDSITGLVTDSLMINALRINGSFDGSPVITNADVSVTHERLNSLMAANKLIVSLGIDTQDMDVYLRRESGIGITLKADIIYDGELEFNSLR